MSRATVTATTAVFVALVLVVGLLAIDRTVLHVYYPNDTSQQDSEPQAVENTPSGPIRTTPEVAQAVRSLQGDICMESEEVGLLEGTPKWYGDRGVWTITCSYLFFDPDTGSVRSSSYCHIVNDRTLEITGGILDEGSMHMVC